MRSKYRVNTLQVFTSEFLRFPRYVATTARCIVYRADVKLLSMNRLSEDFVHTVSALPLDDYAPYLQLISVYGTHYVSSVVMGAKAMVLSEFELTAWNRLKREKFDFSAAAEASFWVVNLKLDVKVSHINHLRHSGSTYTIIKTTPGQ